MATANALGLVPVRMKVSEAGLGLRAGEVRGVAPEVADALIARKQAELVPHPDKDPDPGGRSKS